MSDSTGYMKTDQGITQAELQQALHYDPLTGVFTNRKTGRQLATKAGRYGRTQITISRTARYAARLAWLYVYGEWPQGQVDHINGDHTDHRIANLRVLDTANNCQNKSRARCDNRSGLLGVSWEGRSSKWRARIMVDGRSIALGHYDTPEEAHAAYVKAKRELHPAWSPA